MPPPAVASVDATDCASINPAACALARAPSGPGDPSSPRADLKFQGNWRHPLAGKAGTRRPPAPSCMISTTAVTSVNLIRDLGRAGRRIYTLVFTTRRWPHPGDHRLKSIADCGRHETPARCLGPPSQRSSAAAEKHRPGLKGGHVRSVCCWRHRVGPDDPADPRLRLSVLAVQHALVRRGPAKKPIPRSHGVVIYIALIVTMLLAPDPTWRHSYDHGPAGPPRPQRGASAQYPVDDIIGGTRLDAAASVGRSSSRRSRRVQPSPHFRPGSS